MPSLNNPLVIFIIGPAEHGKTTSRKIVCDKLKLRGASCSDVVYSTLAERDGIPLKDLYAKPKEEIRPQLIALGDWMTGGTELLELPPPKDDKLDKEMKEQFWRMPSALVRVLFHHGVRVIDGVRRPLELDNSRSVLQWFNIHTFVIWIEDPRKPHVKDNTTITKEHADAVILNDGTKDDLEKKIVDCLHKHLDFVDVPDVVVDSKPGLVDANGRPV